MTATSRKNSNKADLLDLYHQMQRIREFERESERQYTRGNIKGFLHVYTGEEAIAVGAITVLEPKDYVITHYRDHGQALVRGVSSKAVMAELFGRSTGCSKGKGGSMHMFDAETNFMGGYAIVGGQLPVATGISLATQYRGEDRVTMCFLGDGALNEGEFHESMNLASIWRLPIIFFCENNLYGMGAPASTTLAMHDEIYKMAHAYKMETHRIDGNDVLAVRDLATEVIQSVRQGKGPIFVEAQTYRQRGHSIADPADYRPPEEVDYWEERDPIPRFRRWLLDQGMATEEELDAIHSQVDEEVVAAAEFAESSPYPEPEDLYWGIYGEEDSR